MLEVIPEGDQQSSQFTFEAKFVGGFRLTFTDLVEVNSTVIEDILDVLRNFACPNASTTCTVSPSLSRRRRLNSLGSAKAGKLSDVRTRRRLDGNILDLGIIYTSAPSDINLPLLASSNLRLSYSLNKGVERLPATLGAVLSDAFTTSVGVVAQLTVQVAPGSTSQPNVSIVTVGDRFCGELRFISCTAVVSNIKLLYPPSPPPRPPLLPPIPPAPSIPGVQTASSSVRQGNSSADLLIPITVSSIVGFIVCCAFVALISRFVIRKRKKLKNVSPARLDAETVAAADSRVPPLEPSETAEGVPRSAVEGADVVGVAQTSSHIHRETTTAAFGSGSSGHNEESAGEAANLDAETSAEKGREQLGSNVQKNIERMRAAKQIGTKVVAASLPPATAETHEPRNEVSQQSEMDSKSSAPVLEHSSSDAPFVVTRENLKAPIEDTENLKAAENLMGPKGTDSTSTASALSVPTTDGIKGGSYNQRTKQSLSGDGALAGKPSSAQPRKAPEPTAESSAPDTEQQAVSGTELDHPNDHVTSDARSRVTSSVPRTSTKTAQSSGESAAALIPTVARVAASRPAPALPQAAVAEKKALDSETPGSKGKAISSVIAPAVHRPAPGRLSLQTRSSSSNLAPRRPAPSRKRMPPDV